MTSPFLPPKSVMWLALAGLSSFVSHDAVAQFNHLSERRPGAGFILGGTGVALDTDPSVSLLNPGRLTAAPSGSFYIGRFVDGRIPFVPNLNAPRTPDQLAVDVDGPSVTGFDVDLLLGGFCYTEDFGTGPTWTREEDPFRTKAKAGHHQLAVCVQISEREEISLLANQADGGVSASVDAAWGRRQIGAAWAWNITSRLSVGVSGFLAISDYQELVLGSFSVPSADETELGTYALTAEGQSFDLAGHLGAVYRANDHVTLGASVRLPSVHLLGDWSQVQTQFDTMGTAVRQAEEGDFVTRQPMRGAMGVGIHGDAFRAEVATYVHAGDGAMLGVTDVRRTTTTTAGIATEEDGRDRSEAADPVANIGIGGEWRAIPDVGLMMGFTTDRNASRAFDVRAAERRLTFRRLDRYHFSGGLHLRGDMGQLLLGARVTWGTGHIRAPSPTLTPPRAGLSRHDELGLLFSIAGRVDIGAVVSILSSKKEPATP